MLRSILTLAVTLIVIGTASVAQSSLGIFESHADIGTVLHAGTATYDSAKKTYTLTGSGENMWTTHDEFQFAWKKVSGDVELTAFVSFANSAGNTHKKAVLMFRQSLDADSIYADIALHNSGLIALQYRDEKAGTTREIQSAVNPQAMESGANRTLLPIRLRLTRRGNYVYLSLPMGYIPLSRDTSSEHTGYDGESIRVPLEGEFYAGIGVCAHDKDAVELALFSQVELKTLTPPSGPPILYSTLETVPISSGDRQVVYVAQGRFEAPNWARDGSYFLFNRSGHLEKLPVAGGQPEVLDTGSANHLNNDHGISPDATQLAVSDNSQETKSANGEPAHDSLVYIVPITGGTSRRITQNSPSYWHGWSPDGKTLAFVGQRNGDFDIYTIAVTGGEETRITTAKRPVHLFQLGAHRPHADLAHAPRRQ